MKYHTVISALGMAAVAAFRPSPLQPRQNTQLLGFSPEFSREENQRRTDIRIFLTQRAIQSFISLLLSCRDPHSVRWMENTYHFQNMESYHGTGAFNLTIYKEWDTILQDMITQEPHQVIIQAKRRGKGHGGWSKNNPHMEERFVEFEIDIDPPSLVQRIVSVRDQIAREWFHDLQTMIYANDLILESYHENQNQLREQEECAVSSDAAEVNEECMDAAALEEDGDVELVESLAAVNDDDDAENKVTAEEEEEDDDDDATPTSLLSTPSSTEESYESEHLSGSADLTEDGTPRRNVFERNMMTLMMNKAMSQENTHGSNPHRKGNFDLLVLLATQESVHRLLREYMADDDRQVSFQWLRDFYVERIPTFFDGNQRYGRADDFLEEILTTPPSFQDMEGGEVGLVDTLRITEDIIAQRTQVANDWLVLMEETPQDHMALQRELLKVRMGNSVENQSNNKESSGSGMSFEDALRAGSEVIEANLNMKAITEKASSEEQELGAFE